MSKHLKWTDRKFEFNFPVELYPEMIERVRGTPARLEDRVKAVDESAWVKRDGARWSIQENAGHLLDLESLVAGRLDEYLAGSSTLHAADMTNRKTFAAEHNQTTMASILSGFRSQRMELVARLDKLEPQTFGAVAQHPRLN